MLYRLTDLDQRVKHNLANTVVNVAEKPEVKPSSSYLDPYLLDNMFTALRIVLERNMIKEDPVYVKTVTENLKVVQADAFKKKDIIPVSSFNAYFGIWYTQYMRIGPDEQV